MVGLAIEGTNYDLKEFTPVTFRNISLILMFSRLVLLVQYAVALWWVKSYKKARLPLLAHITTMFLTAMVFLGLSFFFGRHDGVHILDGWYVVMGLEAVAVLFVSGKTSFLNFRRTNIIERLGLLTLIILGEGIMGLGEQVSKINDGDGVFSSDVVGEIICAVAIVYFIYMLYFDQTETKGKKVGSLQQQLWTIGHFPLHVCILLVVAGIGQFTVWRKVNDYYNGALNTIFAIQMPSPPNNGTADWQAYVDKLNGTLSQNYNGLSSNFSQPLADIIQDPGPDTAWNALYDILGTISVVVAQGFGVDVEADDPEGGQFEILAIFSTVYLYFFISAGLVLILLACIFMLGKKTKTRVEYVSAGMRFAVGIGLVFLATMYIAYFDGSDGKPGDDFWNYFLSPWLTPTVALAYALGESNVGGRCRLLILAVMGLDIVLILLSRMLYVRRGSVSSSVA
jgi:low temperature requirement protein LtrA